MVLAAVWLVSTGTAISAPPPTGDGRGSVELRSIGSFDQPTFLTSAPGRANRKLLFVVEKAGTVRVVRKNKTLKRPFLDISPRVSPDGEQGFLSIAFHPRYQQNRRFYAYFTDRNGDVRIEGFRRSRKRKTVASPRSGTLLKVEEPFANHNGGTLAFGPDRKLYVGTGDGGAACDPNDAALDPTSLLGKLLRIKPKGRAGYKVPRGNPFVGKRGRDEIYATGLRNPYRFSFDEPTNSIAIGDVGQNAWEEIDIATLEATRGANFGWKIWEGNHPADCGETDFDADAGELTFPVHEYPHSGAEHTGCSVTGGVVVRDRRLKSLYGRYIYADFCTGDLRSLLTPADGGGDEKSVGLGLDSPAAFGVGRGNRVYAVSLSGDVSVLRPSAGGARGEAEGPNADATGASTSTTRTSRGTSSSPGTSALPRIRARPTPSPTAR